MQTQEYYNQLIDQLLKYENQYYNQDYSEISDAEFDSLYFEAKTIEELHKDWIRTDSPIKRIMGTFTKGLKEVQHNIPLLSLDKAMDFKELKSWLFKIYNLGINEIFVEPKHDGLACALHYSNGKFIQGITRGNGLIGNDVTQTCWQIPSIPKIINYKNDLEVRGEIFLTKSGLEQINKYIKQYLPKESIKKNVRNTASGLLRDESPNPRKSKYLQFAAYMSLDNQCANHKASMSLLKELGFCITNDFVTNFSINFYGQDFNQLMSKLKKRIENIYNERNNLDFDIDGLVFKINYYNEQQQLGTKRDVPNWAIAYKFPQEEKVSILRDVRWDLGPKGTITPVAIIDPVEILGAVVESPTLHNIDEINRLDIKIGDHVVVTRRGDVIPKIIKVLSNLRTGNEKDIEIPANCPICNQPLYFEEVFVRCNNDKCEGRIAGKIIDFVIKLDIKDFGEKLIKALVKQGSLHNIVDIYKLQINDIAKLEKQGIVSATKVLKHINESKNASLAKIIAGFGIANVGDVTGQDLADYYKSLLNFKNAKVNELIKLNNIGMTVANNIVKWINNNIQLIDDLISLDMGKEQFVNTKLNGLSFAFTGALSTPRKKMQELIINNGGIVSSIKHGLNYLIIGNGAKDHKIEKAKSYNINIINENEFLDLIK